MKRLNRWGLNIIAAIGTVMSLILCLFSWRYTVTRPTWGYAANIQKDSILRNLGFLLAVAAIVYAIRKLMDRFRIERVRGITVAVSVIVCGILFYVIPQVATVPQADQEQVYWGTRWMVEGDYGAIKDYFYFGIYPFQLSLCRLQAYLFEFFRWNIAESYVMMQYVNAVLVALTFFANACIARELFVSAKAEIMCLLCELLFLPMFLYTFFQYGDPIGVCFSVLAVYFVLLALRKEHRRAWTPYLCWALAAFSLFLICVAREFLIIVGIAIVIIAMLLCLREKKLLPFILACICVLAALGWHKLWNLQIEKQTGVDFAAGEPLILPLVMGFQGGTEVADNPGAYNGFNWVTYFDNDGDVALCREAAWDALGQRFGEWADQPMSMVQFFKSKMLNQWMEPSFKAFSVTNLMENPRIWVNNLWYGDTFQSAYSFLDGYQSVLYLFLLGYFLLLFGKDREERDYLIGLAVIGGFLFSFIWESSGRYCYPYMVMALPCVAGSMAHYAGRMEGLCRKGIEALWRWQGENTEVYEKQG